MVDRGAVDRLFSECSDQADRADLESQVRRVPDSLRSQADAAGPLGGTRFPLRRRAEDG